MTKQNLAYSNTLNKSELIRQVYSDHKDWNNREISSHILKIYGVEIFSNLVVNVLGPTKKRQQFNDRAAGIKKLANQLMASCGQDRRLAVLSLRGLI